ncbi:MAG: endonuclease MutS2 [bacterium]
MNIHAQKVLEFDKIKGIISRYSASELGRKLVEELTPLGDVESIREKQRETSQMRNLVEAWGRPPFDGVCDIRPHLDKSEVEGASLQAEELVRIATTLRAGRLIKRFVSEGRELCPLIYDRVRNLAVFVEIEGAIFRAIDESGEIKDSASPALARVRREMRSTKDEIQSKLQGLLGGSFVQEPIITLRNDRYVIPIKRSHKGSIKGIVHDESASGNTLYVEPIAVFDLNNRLHTLAAEERNEILRILSELTEMVRNELPDIRAAVDAIACVDLLYAKAGYSLAVGGVEPILDESGYTNIIEGCHPLLLEILDEVVPVSISFGRDYNTVVITGPNTGGKTVTLKTVGLMALMAQSGLHIPAREGTRLAVYKKIFADIGDEQSIEQSLSSFSSHIKNVVEILREADGSTLALLDEIGAGTDPEEGASLAQAILEELHRRGATVIATTHYGSLKAFAYSVDWAENAAVEFDSNTLKPTFKLLMGVPGGSKALYISERLGVPRHIIDRARELQGAERVRVEDLIATMEDSRRSNEEERARIREELERAEVLRREYEFRLNELKQNSRALREEAVREAEDIVSSARSLVERTVAEIRAQGASKESIKKARSAMDETQNNLSREHRRYRRSGASAESFVLGDRVRILSMNQVGEVVEIGKNAITVQVGIMKVAVPPEDLDSVEVSPGERHRYKSISFSRDRNITGEVDVHSCTVDEAIPIIDKYLDDALLAGLKVVHIVHGKGKGVLRAAVSDFLREHPRIKSFRPGNWDEGGDGVTVAEVD